MKHVKIQEEKIPVIGFGTWSLRDRNCQESVRDALQLGYRHIDTAQIYGNEKEVGKAIKDSEVDREEVFLTTKIWKTNMRYEDALDSTEKSLKRLKVDYVDLLLIHWPVKGIPLKETLGAMDHLKSSDKAGLIGVSNFDADLLDKARRISNHQIFSDQVEYNPLHSQRKLVDYCSKNDILLTAYSPLAKGRVLGNSTLKEFGEKYDKTEAQVTLRWLIQQENVVAIPKASSENHRKENLDIFDFQLNPKEMEKISNIGG
ncbi:hypothetical protein AKJ57_02955 [candidate division MSBL1 archaeon SCGC-AAA259A05]|uniref:NADP-dependent oxidoreductase domain-containing protein n=1 Tax=candidate division MSBL1 archaeon SCGC-AAA259A05 TaxID=1698259 RepID=A0A133U9W6_9EURY|nr:hypothetical protein AKJ57_02955 [candidate division MSBL1 archaeon SCGC-AAA259A05]